MERNEAIALAVWLAGIAAGNALGYLYCRWRLLRQRQADRERLALLFAETDEGDRRYSQKRSEDSV